MESSPETLETLQSRHRKEQRDLQSRVTSKKKNATKKTRKGVNDECAELERQLKERQELEIAALSGSGGGGSPDDDDQQEEEEGSEPNGLSDKLESTSISDPAATEPTAADKAEQRNAQAQSSEGAGAGKKRNRQQERLARRRAEQEAAAVAAEEDAKNMTNHKAIEKTSLVKEFKANGLVEEEIQPDGHCLFSAVADQLVQRNIPLGGGEQEGGQKQLPYKVVRRRATDYMESHRDDFAPFLEEDFGQYIRKIRDTAEWGGQLELKALADSYGVEIKVVQDGRTETIEPGGGGQPGETPRIWLAYYRHGYGLGEHYNSLRKAS